MRSDTRINKIPYKELIVIYCIGVYTFFYLPILLGQISADKISTTSSVDKSAETSNEISKQGKWLVAGGEYVTIYYDEAADLKAIERRLRRKIFFFGESRSREDLSEPQKVLHRLDLIFNKAQQILEMHPANIHIKVKIFSSQEELDDLYYTLFKTRVNFKGFYIHAHNTIYTAEDSISDSVIIHEMGHAIVDHYFSMTPPPKVGELLAQYVDMHLED